MKTILLFSLIFIFSCNIEENKNVDKLYKNFDKIHTAHILDNLGLKRYCCRRNLIANIDMMEII